MNTTHSPKTNLLAQLLADYLTGCPPHERVEFHYLRRLNTLASHAVRDDGDGIERSGRAWEALFVAFELGRESAAMDAWAAALDRKSSSPLGRIRRAVQRLRQRIQTWSHNRNWQRGRRRVAMAAAGLATVCAVAIVVSMLLNGGLL
jgi:hypothetical protein